MAINKTPVYLPDSPRIPVSLYLKLSCVERILHTNIERLERLTAKYVRMNKDTHLLLHSSSFLLPEVHWHGRLHDSSIQPLYYSHLLPERPVQLNTATDPCPLNTHIQS